MKMILIALIIGVLARFALADPLSDSVDQTTNTIDETSKIADKLSSVETDILNKYKLTNAGKCALLVMGMSITNSVPVYFVPGPRPISGLQADVMDANGVKITGIVAGADTDAMGKQVTSNNIGGGFRFILIGFNQTILNPGEVANVQIDSSGASAGSHVLTLTNFVATGPDGVEIPLCATTGVISK